MCMSGLVSTLMLCCSLMLQLLQGSNAHSSGLCTPMLSSNPVRHSFVGPKTALSTALVVDCSISAAPRPLIWKMTTESL